MKKINRLKKVIFSFLSLSLPAIMLGNFFTFNNTNANNNYSYANKSKKADDSVDLTSQPTYADSLPVANSNITSFASYQPSYEDNNIAQISQLNGTVGMTSDKKTLTFTSYDGLLIWSNNLTQNVLLQKYYEQILSINDISSYTVINYTYNASTETLIVLFGSTTNTNEVIFGVDLLSGYIYTQPNVTNIDFGSNKNIVKVNDGICLLYSNSKGQIIATTGNTVASYGTPSNTIVLSFSKDLGFGNVPFSSIIVQPDNTNDLLLGFMPASSNTNYAVFLSATPTSESLDIFDGSANVSTQVYKFSYYAYVVDNNLKTLGSKITFNSSFYYSQSSTLVFNNIKKRFYSATTSGAVDSWFWCDSAIVQKSGVTKLTYDASNYSATENFVGTLNQSTDLTQAGINYNNLTVNSISYDWINQRVFESFSGLDATNNYHILNTAVNLSNLSVVESPWITENNITYLAPLYSSTLNSSDTYVISYNNAGTSIFLANSSSFTQQTNLNVSFNKINDVVNAITSNTAIYKGKMPSQISADDLKSCITFAASTNSYTVTVSNLTPDDNAGTLSFSYNVADTITYGSGSINYSFNFNVNLNGLFSLTSDFEFDFITHSSSNGDATIDNKWQQIVNLKNTTVPSNISAQNILDYFLDYSIINNQGQSLTISQDWITLNPDDSQGSLGVTVSIPASSMPAGFPTSSLTKSYTYTGFVNLQGYTKQIITTSTNITQLKQIKYASQISFSDIIDNFVTLGSSYSKNINDWTFTIDSSGTSDYTGTLSFRLIYSSSSLPSGTSDDVKNVFGTPTTWYQITGFKTIYSNYTNISLPISDYSGLANANSLWTQYQNAIQNNDLSSSTLYNSIDVNQWLDALHLTNFSDINITANNLDTADSDGYLLLGVGYKDNVTTNLNISGQNFVFDSTAKTNFQQHFGNNYPFVVKWNLTQYVPEFHWVIPTTSSAVTSYNDDSISIDLSKSSFQGINNTMKASDVTAQNITALFSIINYTIVEEPQLYADDTKGTLTAVITLEPDLVNKNQQQDQTVTKNVYIQGFRIGAPQAVGVVPIVVGTVCALILIASILWVIAWHKKHNKFMYMQNLKKKKK